jgi:membrane protein
MIGVGGTLVAVSTVDSGAPLWKRIFELLKASAEEFGEDNGGRMAAAIAYRTVFALAPLLLVAVSVASLFLDSPTSDCEVTAVASCKTIQQQLVLEVEKISEPLSEPVDDIMTNAGEGAATSGTVGIAILLFTASSLFLELQRSLNTIFHAPAERTKGILATLRARGIGAVAVLLLGAILVILFAANAVVSGAGSFLIDVINDVGLDGEFFAPLVKIAGPLVTVLLLVVVFAVQFQTFTAMRIPWKAAWRGGAVTAIVFAAGAIGIGAYFAFASQGETTFSAGGFAGGAVLILFTVFILAQIYLLGAEFTKVYGGYLTHGDIVSSAIRADRRKPDITADDVRAAATTDLIARVGVFAFVAGLVVGWFRSR